MTRKATPPAMREGLTVSVSGLTVSFSQAGLILTTPQGETTHLTPTGAHALAAVLHAFMGAAHVYATAGGEAK